jgi:hypothetical protein
MRLDIVKLHLNLPGTSLPLRQKRRRSSSLVEQDPRASSGRVMDSIGLYYDNGLAPRNLSSQYSAFSTDLNDTEDFQAIASVGISLAKDTPYAEHSFDGEDSRVQQDRSCDVEELESGSMICQDLAFKEILPLIDAGIRSMISSTPTNISPSVKVTREYPGPALTALAPSIWSPGYLPVRLTF